MGMKVPVGGGSRQGRLSPPKSPSRTPVSDGCLRPQPNRDSAFAHETSSLITITASSTRICVDGHSCSTTSTKTREGIFRLHMENPSSTPLVPCTWPVRMASDDVQFRGECGFRSPYLRQSLPDDASQSAKYTAA